MAGWLGGMTLNGMTGVFLCLKAGGCWGREGSRIMSFMMHLQAKSGCDRTYEKPPFWGKSDLKVPIFAIFVVRVCN